VACARGGSRLDGNYAAILHPPEAARHISSWTLPAWAPAYGANHPAAAPARRRAARDVDRAYDRITWTSFIRYIAGSGNRCPRASVSSSPATRGHPGCRAAQACRRPQVDTSAGVSARSAAAPAVAVGEDLGLTPSPIRAGARRALEPRPTGSPSATGALLRAPGTRSARWRVIAGSRPSGRRDDDVLVADLGCGRGTTTRNAH